MSSIRNAIIKGVFWSAVEKYSSLAVSIVISMVLARLLSPEMYGEVAIASIILGFLSMISSMGMGPAIIQNRSLTHNDLNTIYTFSFFLGIILAVVLWCASWGISSFYEIPHLVVSCQILCINLFFATINMVPHALMVKNQRFKDIAKRTLLFQTTSGLISIIAALEGAGIYALLISPIVTSIGTFFYNLHCYPLSFSKKMSFKPIKKVISFSAYLFAFDIFNFFSQNLDKLIIGKYMSPMSLGYYEKSYRLMQMPLGYVTSVISPVLQPVLSTLQDNTNEIANKYNKIIKFISTISFPLATFLYCSSYEIINIFYGDKWDKAIIPFAILSLSLPTHMILATSGSIWLASNCPKCFFWTGAINTCITIAGFAIAAIIFGTIESLAWSWTFTSIVNFFNTHLTMYIKVLRSSIFVMLSLLIHPCINALVIYLLMIFIRQAFVETNLIVSLIGKISITISITLLYTQCSGRYNLIKLVKDPICKNK